MNISKCKLELCKINRLKMDQIGSILFVLECMYNENYPLLDVFDDMTSNKNALIIYKEMEKVKLLKREKFDDKTVHFSLTYEGKIFCEQLAACEDDKEFIMPINERVADWIKDWVNLWKDEKGVNLRDKAGKRSLGISEKDAYERMNLFLGNYGYIFKGNILTQREIIMGATKMYIAEFKKVNYVYCRGAFNFLQKNEDGDRKNQKSTLAEYCENFLAIGIKQDEPEFSFGRPVL